MVDYIDGHKEEFGVEPICKALQFAPSTYYAAKSRVPSARTLRDAVLMPIILALWQVNFEAYGARKLWKAARRAGHEIGRDQVARLTKTAGICGVTRSRRVRTTRSDSTGVRHPDLVDRRFVADRPNALWVTDLTYVATRGWRTCVSSPTRSAVASSGGGSLSTCEPRLSSTPWRWHDGPGAPASKGSSRTRTPAANSPLCVGVNDSSNWELNPRSARWETAC